MRNETYAALWALLREAAGLFPDSYVHLGGDEVPFTCWQVCACDLPGFPGQDVFDWWQLYIMLSCEQCPCVHLLSS